jgi:3-isopropylmalate dehydrogenase
MKKTIAVLAGDGIGQEVVPCALAVIHSVAKKFNHDFTFVEGAIGGDAFDKSASHFPEETRTVCTQADAVLFGSVGGPVAEAHLPKWTNCERNSILSLRKTLNLSANLRPITIPAALGESSPLKNYLIREGIDILIVRELLGDIYFGDHLRWNDDGVRYASDVAEYNEDQIRSVAERSFQFAQNRRKKLTSVDKANVLDTSKLWREIVTEVSHAYPDVELTHMLVDNCAMQLMLNPAQFDVVVTSNLFGDILSDAAAALPGSLGLIPSASLADNTLGLYEPAGGSAPDIAGKDIANPIAQILSAAMMFRHSFDLETEAQLIENAVRQTLNAGWRTRDIYTPKTQLVGTKEMTNKVLAFI